MKRFLSLMLSAALLTASAGCAAPAKDYALARAKYPTLTSYAEAYETVSKYEQSGMIDWEKLDEAYAALDEAMELYHSQQHALRSQAAAHAPKLTDFAAETAKELFAERTENTVYSPANLYMALSMLAEATDGETRSEITALLGSEDTRSAAKALWAMLYENGQGITFAANSMWTGEIVPVKQSLADTLAEHYYADSFTVPMGTEEANKTMHTWLNEHTGNLLEEAVDGIESSPETVLALMSTLYFKHAWKDEFLAESTYADTFTKADGREITVDFMHDSGSGVWYQGENYVVSGRRFQEDGVRMLFILPDEGVLPEQLLTDPDTLSEILTAEHDQYSRIAWSVPKFDVTANMELSEHLQTLGITRAFDFGTSDYSPVTDDVDLALSQVQHAARVTIDEYGCTAAAFTVMMMEMSAMLPPDAVLEMNLNRPFAFVILDGTNIPLFIGTVYNP